VLLFTEKQPTSIAIGWSEPVPGREFHLLKSSACSRRTVTTIGKSDSLAAPNTKTCNGLFFG